MIRRSRLLGEGRQPSKHIQRLASEPISLQHQHTGPLDALEIADTALILDKECILERCSLVSSAPAHMPYIAFHGKYNKRWYVDVVSLPQNSIRLFISKLFEILSATHRLALDMTADDFRKLFAFIAEFDRYLRVLLDAEDKILYPEVESALKKRSDFHSHRLNPSLRLATKKKLYSLLDAFTDPTLKTTPSVTVATRLQETLDLLWTELLDYFTCKEAELPRILAKSTRAPKEKNRLESRLIKYFEDINHEFHYTAILTAPLRNDDVRIDFEERHFSKSKREQYRDAAKHLDDTLFSIPNSFTAAASKYEARFSMKLFLENYGTDRDTEATTELVP